MKTMTPGEQAVWAARFTQAQADHFQAELQRRLVEQTDATPAMTQQEQAALVMEATDIAVEQAHNAVVLLRSFKASDGADMLREILGRPPVLPMPAPLEWLPEPFNRAEPPPMMMFADGRSDVVKHVDSDGLDVELTDLAAAWKDHVDHIDPPGFVIVAVDGIPFGEDATDHEYEPRLHRPDGGEMVLGPQQATAVEARAFCWRCHEKPHHVSFWARFGEQTGTSMAAILEWTDAQMSEAWAYLQVRAEWDSKRPALPSFWEIEE